MASFGMSGDCEELEIMNMDEEIKGKNGNDSLHCGLSVWLKEINLLGLINHYLTGIPIT